MKLDSDSLEIEVPPDLDGLSRTLRVADVIRRRDLDFVSKPGELVESEFETGSLSAAGRKAFALMLRKAGPEAGEDGKTFTITKNGQALQNVVAVLAEGGARPEHIVRMTWYVTDRKAYVAAYPEIGHAFREVIGSFNAAMTAVEVAGLIEDRAQVEIEVTAVIPD